MLAAADMTEANLSKNIDIERVKVEGEYFFKISNYDVMRPFFMSIVSDSNHWMFISSNGGLTAGRKNAEYALFPYYTEDKITELAGVTGSKSIFQVQRYSKAYVWEPFSKRTEGIFDISRNIYKNNIGNKVLFEEVNHDLGVTFRYEWSSSNLYGFIRKSTLINNSETSVKISILDGIQNILPDGVGSDLQNSTSNLVDAYKRSELEPSVGLGIYALSAIIVDKAEPSEALKANIVWSLGLDKPKHLLSSLQVNNFRNQLPIDQETDVKAEKGAYFLNSEIKLESEGEKKWMMVADVNKSHSSVVQIIKSLENSRNLEQEVKNDIDLGTRRLIEYNASSDGLQLSADIFRDTRHFSNTLFNIMRGGIFDFNYQIEKWDLLDFLNQANKNVLSANKATLDSLPDTFTFFELNDFADKIENKDFKRLCFEYMPLKFSRRHGDPSRPWNKFSINTRSELDGSKILDYEGNWRDIFQNWEATGQAFPAFVESMIHKFLNASTFEGYNPYRVTKHGFDWETIEPDNPWSYIGYWGDHQIIYLLKLLELSEKHFPGQLKDYFNNQCFVYANVPYKIKNYEQILENPKDTIEFDEELDNDIRNRRTEIGSDASLLSDENGGVYTVNFIEKILATVLSKLSNFIPEGGIWMNTQRPEWNDANNALVGNGVSMVTLYYLRRFLTYFRKQLENTENERVELSNELIIFYKRIRATFEEFHPLLDREINDKERKQIMNKLGYAGSDYREHIYKQGFWGKKRTSSYKGLIRFVDLSLDFIDHSINANKRKDNLYHAYNLMTIKNEDEVSISYLSEMLEGQVAVLSSGKLEPTEALSLLDALKQSSLFREDQYSYILYPNKNLPGFLQRNNIPKKLIDKSELLTQLVNDNELSIVKKDVNNHFHFNGNFKNASDLSQALDQLDNTMYGKLAIQDRKLVLTAFEEVFNHKAFTGRSGTFYGYEGLGSIYWHMVSKLQLAVQEVCLKAVEQNENEGVVGRLLEHYYEINEGIGVHKSPKLYGAFPTDAYSHTPAGKGAQQPGMTGQVKEDILSRFGELGAFVKNGQLLFNPCLLRKDEFVIKNRTFEYVDIEKNHKFINLEKGQLSFTYCQVPVIYKMSDKNKLVIRKSNNKTIESKTLLVDPENSLQIFKRTGEVSLIEVEINEANLK